MYIYIYLLLLNYFVSRKSVQGPTSRHTVSFGNEHSSWTNRANNSKMESRTRIIYLFPPPSFCPTCYGLSNVMRRKGTRHAFIECRVTGREKCNKHVEESMEKRMLLSNNHCKCTFCLRDYPSHPLPSRPRDGGSVDDDRSGYAAVYRRRDYYTIRRWRSEAHSECSVVYTI